MKNEANAVKTTWHGDYAVYTGVTKELYGATFYEIRMIEGHLKGETKLTQRGPK
jgi:hypothetical protein